MDIAHEMFQTERITSYRDGTPTSGDQKHES